MICKYTIVPFVSVPYTTFTSFILELSINTSFDLLSTISNFPSTGISETIWSVFVFSSISNVISPVSSFSFIMLLSTPRSFSLFSIIFFAFSKFSFVFLSALLSISSFVYPFSLISSSVRSSSILFPSASFITVSLSSVGAIETTLAPFRSIARSYPSTIFCILFCFLVYIPINPIIEINIIANTIVKILILFPLFVFVFFSIIIHSFLL